MTIKIPCDEVEYGDGICLACGFIQSGCEPDARNYECGECGEKQVFGIEEALIMGIPPDDGDIDAMMRRLQ